MGRAYAESPSAGNNDSQAQKWNGAVHEDARLGDLKTLDGYFPFQPPSDLATWETRRERVRRQILVAAGLWPMPPRPELQPVIHGKIDRGDYTVEKVYFESLPGFYVTGNLYRPTRGKAPYPAVLSPHGHWPNGRFYDSGEAQVARDIESGAERFPVGGRFPIQARCMQLARMGCVVFHYDMIGYADSRQMPHRPGIRPHLNTAERWGFFSPRAELLGQNMLGLQTFNSIRALDFLCSLPDVDASRIGVTGASGGGTQTFLVCAVDPRPKVSFPAVMVSTAMQGGCTCENACYLRIDTGNVEFAGLFAPKPLGMTAADDWTKEIATKGLPELRQLYTLYGVPELVMAEPLLQFPHNYNYVSRGVMYRWMNRHLGLGLQEPIVEEDFQPLTREEMSVWDGDHPVPAGGEDWETAFLANWQDINRRQMESLLPTDAESWEQYRRILGGAFDVIIGRPMPKSEEIACDSLGEEAGEGFRVERRLVRNLSRKECVPVLELVPEQPTGATVVWVSAEGKRAIWAGANQPVPLVERFLQAGIKVVAVDTFGQGEFTSDGEPWKRARLVKTDDFAGFTFGYNPPLFAQRVHDLLSVTRYLRDRYPTDKLWMIGLEGAGRWVAAARVQAGEAVDLAVCDDGDFRFVHVTEMDDPDFLPSAAKFGDLPALLSLSAPLPLWCRVAGSDDQAVIRRCYAATQSEGNLRLWPEMPQDPKAAWMEELLKQVPGG
ncbi:hypothetical protein JCM17478_05240 [Thermopirellula anaerolimosa]